MDAQNIVQIPIRTCKKHTFEELVVYCKDCLIFICSLCVREDHLEHKCEGVSKFARDVRSQIPSFCKDVNEKSITSMQADLEKLETTFQENDEKYKNEQGKLQTLQEQYIDAVNQVFGKREKDCYQKLYTCNSKIKDHVARLATKIDTLQDRVKTHNDAQAAYSNHDVIEMHTELQNMVAQYNPLEYDPKPHVLETMDDHECFDVKLEDLTSQMEGFVFNRNEGKI